MEDPNTAWQLASLYLSSIGAQPISEEALQIVGMSAELMNSVTCRSIALEQKTCLAFLADVMNKQA